MSEVAPPSTALPPATLAALQRLVATQVPPDLAALPANTKLDVIVALIAASGDHAELKLTSDLGNISVRLPAAAQTTLKPGDPLILQLLSKGLNPKVQLATADGKLLSFTSPAGAQATASTSGTPAGVQHTAPTGAQITPGAVINATLLRPITVNAAHILQLQGNPGQPVAGGSPTQSVPSGGPGFSGPAPSAQATQASGGAQTAGNISGSAPTSQTAGGITAFPAGSGLELKIVSVSVPASTPQSLVPPPVEGQISLAPGAFMNGIVSGRQGVGQTVVQTHAGPVSLPTAQPLPTGTEIRFEIVSLNAPLSGAAQHGPLHAAQAPLLDGDWLAFDEALQVLHEISPGAHQHVMQTALPRADTQLATNVLFFLSALRGGDIKNWLGDGPTRILDKLRPDLAGRLRGDMTQMTRTVDDPQGGDWRLHGVPFLFGNEIDRIQLMIRDQENADSDEGDDKGSTRFVVDLNLSKLGHLQIDGLVGEKNKRLDLVLRTDEPLQPNIREDIRMLYNDALELTGLEGSVGFQAQPGNFVNIPKRPAASQGGGVMA